MKEFILTAFCIFIGIQAGKFLESRKRPIMFNRGFEAGSTATFLTLQKDLAQGKFTETMAQALVNARDQYSKMGGSLSTNR